jgi:hypothetical protein
MSCQEVPKVTVLLFSESNSHDDLSVVLMTCCLNQPVAALHQKECYCGQRCYQMMILALPKLKLSLLGWASQYLADCGASRLTALSPLVAKACNTVLD